MSAGVLFDVDGTLVDSNYLHVVAWSDAFRACGYAVDMCDVLPLVGQGSDRLVESLIGHPDDDVAAAHADFYGSRLYGVRPFVDAVGLVRRVHSAGLAAVLATSAGSHEISVLRATLGVDDVLSETVTKDDADSSKPAPDIVSAAIEAAGLEVKSTIFVGDSVWDVKAAAAAQIPCVCVLTGGIPESELRAAGALAVYRSASDLLAKFEESPLGALAATGAT